MRAYKMFVTIKDPKCLTLENLPFKAGERVEVVMIADDEEREKRGQELRSLLKKTQALPAAKAVTEDMIAEEIAAYRAGK